MTHGWMTQATYTLARGVDNAPLTGTYVVGSGDDRVSDPTNLDREEGLTPFNQTHTLSVSAVIAPQVGGSGLGALLLNNNQLGFILQANSGLPFNIRSMWIEQGRVRTQALGLTPLRPLGRVAIRSSFRDSSRWAALARKRFFEAKNSSTCRCRHVNRVVTTKHSVNWLRPCLAIPGGTG